MVEEQEVDRAQLLDLAAVSAVVYLLGCPLNSVRPPQPHYIDDKWLRW